MAVLARLVLLVVLGLTVAAAATVDPMPSPDPWTIHEAEIKRALELLDSDKGHAVLRNATERAITDRLETYLATAGSGQEPAKAMERMERGVAKILIAYLAIHERLVEFEGPGVQPRE